MQNLNNKGELYREGMAWGNSLYYCFSVKLLKKIAYELFKYIINLYNIYINMFKYFYI